MEKKLRITEPKGLMNKIVASVIMPLDSHNKRSNVISFYKSVFSAQHFYNKRYLFNRTTKSAHLNYIPHIPNTEHLVAHGKASDFLFL